MAQKVNVIVTDDITGEVGAKPCFFALDENMFEIDLTAANRAQLRKDLDRYIEHAHSPSLDSRRSHMGARANGGRRNGSAPRDRERSSAIRAWAKKKGYDVSDRGRIPGTIQQEYDAEFSLSGQL